MIDCFKHAQCFPRLVFLHMCAGGITETDATILQAFSGFAPKLIHANIASVVAMQYPIANDDARDFSLAFYATLAKGDSVDEAVQEGRYELDRHRSSRVFGTPVLYMHCAEALALPQEPPESSQLAGSSIAQGRAGEGVGAIPTPETIDPAISAKITEAASDTAAQPAATPETADQAALTRAIKAGLDATAAIADDNAKMAMRRRLLRMKGKLEGKTVTEIFNTIFQQWDEEADPRFKEVLELAMTAV
jgi:hypothetical protein